MLTNCVGRCLRSFVGHLSVVRSLAFMKGVLLSGSSDGSVRKWDVSTGICFHIAHTKDCAITTIATKDQKLYVGSAEANAHMFIL